MAIGIFTSAGFTSLAGVAQIASAALVEVRKESDNTLAPLFADVNGTTPISNPLTADSEGQFSFYAAGLGRGYKVTVTKGASVRVLRNVAIGTGAEYDISDIIGPKLNSSTLALFLTSLGLGTADTPSFAQLALAGDPVSNLQAATKQYVDTLAFGLDAKPSVRVATTGNISLSGEQTIDGVLTALSRVLVKDQAAPAQNGVYVSAAGAWVRSIDIDIWTEVPGAFVFVEAGTINADSGWLSTADQGGTLNTTAITWVQFHGPTLWQPRDADLTAIAALTSAADQLPYATGAQAWALTTLTATARTLLDDTSVTAMRATLQIAGKESIPVPCTGMTPRSANGCAPIALSTGAANQPDVPFMAFDGAAKEYASFLMRMPKSWNESTITVAFDWRRASGTGAANVVWGVRAAAVSDNETPAITFGSDATVTDAASTTTANFNLSGETAACTIAGSPAEGDLVFFEVFRDGAAGGDTLDAVDAWLTGVTLFITLNETNDA